MLNLLEQKDIVVADNNESQTEPKEPAESRAVRQGWPAEPRLSQLRFKDERPPLPPLPESISINEFREKPLSEIYSMLEVLPVKIPAKASKSQLSL